MMADVYEALMAHARETAAIEQVAGRLSWDQETMMPRGAGAQRGEEMAAMEGVLHARRIDPRVGEWLAKVDPVEVVAKAQVARIRRSYQRAMKVPARLSQEIARVTSLSQGIWAEARAGEAVANFLPTLSQVVDLKREEAAALASGGDLYDAMLDDYEPGMTGAECAAMFDALRPRLVALRERILASPRKPEALSGSFGADAQIRLSRRLAMVFGYDLQRGRVDTAVHPFCSGSGDDVRITTRVAEGDPFNCLYSTIHETGHAAYEQGVDSDLLLTPIGGGVSMGVHESQSRICENQLGRSRPFTEWLFGEMRDRFGEFGIQDPEAFYATVNRVSPGYIRTESDEVHYNLHVMLRFDLERALIAGDLAVADLEGAWNERSLADFGVAVDKPSNGMLQDVHWSIGLFGYFPTYTLGNLYAGCLNQALRRDLPGLDQDLAKGELGAANDWLRENLRRHGGIYSPRETIARACGEEPSAEPLLDYLETKFAGIYGF
ncbi:carboxypeptidase M32 [Xinfangfangia sp. D13-10-4-6]|uniref:carboxypeptidase M32 n=1 Tax=Pseudogemmobacter hezensis TaxID=2737662 RepID=UPI001554AE45|nr:carboxypeptidase M32 [Pseudogemmobacter hezensis]NPD15879.1 carboxypeptidase M32 [Pseudogemmobacter hezensis]